MIQKFALFENDETQKVEEDLNEWASKLPEGARIRRTQLSTGFDTANAEFVITVLVNYELPDGEEDDD